MSNVLLQNDIEEVREAVAINDLSGATWAFRKLRAIEEKKKEITSIAIEEKKRIDEWVSNETKSLNADKEYFEGLLSAYYIEERAKDKKFKLTTPYGKVTSRKTEKYIYEDEQAIMDYCNMNELDVIRIKEELDKSAFKKICKGGVNQETGEVVPGVRVETVESISIKAE